MKNLFYFIFILLISLKSFAHGENKPGPNGGYIRMPGPFHTELVPQGKDKSFYIYLLDLAFTNPSIKNSSLEMILEQKQNKISFKCEVMGNTHYHCKSDKDYDQSVGKLTINSKRENASGTSVYELPLKWVSDSADIKKMNHGSHH